MTIPAYPGRERATLRSYSHLEKGRKVPSEYELVTTGLHYYTKRGFEVDTPLGQWHQRLQSACPITLDDWDRFADPRETTYAGYVARQSARTEFLQHIFQSMEHPEYDGGLSPAWVRTLDRLWAPLRFPFHGLQMVAAYVGQMAPSGRVTVAAAFQVGDEIQRVQVAAYRTRQLQTSRASFGGEARTAWQADPAWQPLREVVERLLVVWDWGEAFAALNLCLKPLLDELVLGVLAREARRQGDPLLGEILGVLADDCRWHQQWSGALVGLLMKGGGRSAEALVGWVGTWRPRAHAAITALAPLLGAAEPVVPAIEETTRQTLVEMGIPVSPWGV